MGKAIGPHFADELLAKESASGITIMGNPFSWGSDGVLSFGDACPANVRQAVEEVYAEHDPSIGLYLGTPVWNASSVDAVTIKRIAEIAGDVNSQLKALRLAVWAQHVKSNGNAFGQGDKADAIITASLAMNAQVEAIRAEGIAFKQSKGWV